MSNMGVILGIQFDIIYLYSILSIDNHLIMRNRGISAIILNKINSSFGRIIVVTGARQTGKTTLIKQMFPDYKYISIEDPVTVGAYKSMTASQWNSMFSKAILDEIQKEPQIVESIKAVYDQYPGPRYILLGSSQILLLKKIRESLAGRCQIVEMYPLTLPEMLTNGWEDKVNLSYFQNLILNRPTNEVPFLLDDEHPQKQKAFDTYMKYGAYPAISDIQIDDEDKLDWLRNYVKTYLERDVRDLAELRNLEPFSKIQKLVALSTAQLMNYSQIAVEAGVSAKTVQRFIEYMSISYQTLVLPPWSRNVRKRLVKSSKVHQLDVGVMRAILQKRDELNGHEFESFVVAEIYKQVKTVGAEVSLYHLRTLDGREVDLLIETEEGYIAIEVKKTSTVRATDTKHLKGLDDILDKPILHRFIITNDLSNRGFSNGVKAISAVKFLT